VVVQRPPGSGLPGTSATDEIVVGVNQEVTWLKNLALLLQQHSMKDNLLILI